MGTNLVTAGLLIHQHQARKLEIYADHLEDLRVAVQDGTLRARLGDSREKTSATLVLTPHAAIQIQGEFGRMFALIQQKAAEAAKGQPAAPISPDRSL